MSKAALRAQQELAQAANDLRQAIEEFGKHPSLECTDALSRTLQNLERPMRALEYADEDDRSMELLRALEMHGAGLLPFSFTGRRFEPCDVLITSARNLAIITAVSETGEIVEVAGSIKSRAIVGGEFVLTWRPQTQARVWLPPGKEAAPGYKDLGKALTYLVRQWANRQSDEGYGLTTGVAFFVDAVNAPGLKLNAKELYTFSEPADVVAYCEKRGEGLEAWQPGRSLVAGDFLMMRRRKAWGVVTRNVADERVEALIGGLGGKGELREPAGAVRLVRKVTPADVEKIWRPDGKLRR